MELNTGKLYNWYAVKDPRGLAPKGWHIPNDFEWQILEDTIGHDKCGIKMKNTQAWSEPLYGETGNITNSSNFSALPGGERCYGASFYYLNGVGSWWSTTEEGNLLHKAFYRSLGYKDDHLFKGSSYKYYGRSVRCIKD